MNSILAPSPLIYMGHLGEHVEGGLVPDAMLLRITDSDRLSSTLCKHTS